MASKPMGNTKIFICPHCKSSHFTIYRTKYGFNIATCVQCLEAFDDDELKILDDPDQT